ncbi:MAG: hypothetical protein CVU94_01960 [Firmicutes bacterium HGW-Firmicutes-19]|jgi:hypothetical protein|nr:MAG: hypothetical protein CVU94_01960 [Firmicutes bacterium HGW-Firmicutes-19]
MEKHKELRDKMRSGTQERFMVVISYRDKRPDKAYPLQLSEKQVKNIVEKMTPQERAQCNVIGFSNLRIADKDDDPSVRLFHSYKDIEKR